MLHRSERCEIAQMVNAATVGGARGSSTARWHTVRVRLTEFWERMEEALGAGYYRSWAQDHVLPELGGRTVNQALSQGRTPRPCGWRCSQIWDFPRSTDRACRVDHFEHSFASLSTDAARSAECVVPAL